MGMFDDFLAVPVICPHCQEVIPTDLQSKDLDCALTAFHWMKPHGDLAGRAGVIEAHAYLEPHGRCKERRWLEVGILIHDDMPLKVVWTRTTEHGGRNTAGCFWIAGYGVVGARGELRWISFRPSGP